MHNGDGFVVSLDLAIMGFLAQRPQSGYDLKRRCFSGPVASFWPADQAQIYRTLERLRAAGFVDSSRRRQAGRPDRRIFELTSKGRDSLNRTLAAAPAAPRRRDAFLLQLFFSSSLDDDDVRALLTAARDHHQLSLAELRAHSTRLAASSDMSARSLVLRQTALDGAIAEERSVIDWLDDCIEAVEQGALPQQAEAIGQRTMLGS